MLPNPYTPGQVPRVLVGRSVELDRIRSVISRVATFGELGGPLLVFHAPRGVGKTSLLRTAQRQAAEVGFVTAWVACSRERPFLPELVRAVERALTRAEVIPPGDAGAGWRARLDGISVEFGLPGAKIRADLARRDDAPEASPGVAPIAALEDLLHEAATAVRRRGGAGLLVFLDELHAASADDMATLLNALQNLDGEREDNPVAVITAGLPVTPEALTRAATFGERSAFVPLDLLSEADARAALTEPAESLGVEWSPEALDRVVAEAQGHPYFLQLIGSATWNAARPEEVVFGARAYTQYGCSACHGIDGKGGVSPQVPGITAAAPDPAADIKKVIENGIGVSADAQAPFMPSWNRIIPDAQIDGLVAYIQAGVPVVLGIDQERPGPTLSPKTAGAMLYVADGCQNCHGVNGLGGVPNKGSADGSIPPVAGADFASEFDTPAKIRDMIVNGSVVAKPPVAAMPRWGGVLTDSEIDALVAYIQSLTPAK